MDNIDLYVLGLLKRYLVWIKSNDLEDTINNYMFYIDNIDNIEKIKGIEVNT